MIIEHLREYVELAQCLSFTEAARRMNVSQSALSKHLVALEAEFGVTLVERDRRHVELTRAGSLLLREGTMILDSFDGMKARVSAAGSDPMLKIGVRTQKERILWLVSSALHEAGTAGDSFDFSFRRLSSGNEAEDLLLGSVDVLFCYEGTFGPDAACEVSSLYCYKDPFVAVVGEAHPLASRQAVSMKDLKHETLVRFFHPGFRSGWANVEATCLRHGFEPKARMVSFEPGNDYIFAPIEDDVLVLSRATLEGQMLARDSRYRQLPLSDEDACFHVSACYLTRSKNKTLAKFVQYLASVVEKDPGYPGA